MSSARHIMSARWPVGLSANHFSVTFLRTVLRERAGILAAVAALTVLYGAAYFSHASALGLYTDDWWHLFDAASYSFRALLHTWPADFRPLEMAPWILAYPIFGHALVWYYGLLFVIEHLTALVLFALVRALSGSIMLGLAAAALWAVYPADNAVFWLTSFAYCTGALFLLLAVALLVLPGNRRSHLAYWSAVPCCLLCLLSNEIYLGLAGVLPLVAMWVAWNRRWITRLVRAVPFVLVLGAYMAYRLWFGPHVLRLADFKASNFALSMPHAWGMLAKGVQVVLTLGWRDTAEKVLSGRPALTPLRQAFGTTEILLSLGLAALALAGLTWLLRAWRGRGFWDRRFVSIRPGIGVLCIGALAIAGGYVPLAVTVDAPTVAGVDFSVNAAACLGAAAFVAGALWVIVHWLLPRRIASIIFLTGMAALLALGLAGKQEDATHYADVWATQRQVWQAVLTAAPALRPNTFVLLVPRDRASSAVLDTLSPWGVNNALQLLYLDQHSDVSVQGDVLPISDWWRACRTRHASARPWLTVPALLFLQGGLQMRVLHQFVPYQRVVILQYDVQNGGLVQVVQGRYSLPWGCSAVSSPDRIIHTVSARASWEDIVSAPDQNAHRAQSRPRRPSAEMPVF